MRWKIHKGIEKGGEQTNWKITTSGKANISTWKTKQIKSIWKGFFCFKIFCHTVKSIHIKVLRCILFPLISFSEYYIRRTYAIHLLFSYYIFFAIEYWILKPRCFQCNVYLCVCPEWKTNFWTIKENAPPFVLWNWKSSEIYLEDFFFNLKTLQLSKIAKIELFQCTEKWYKSDANALPKGNFHAC